jgi:LacI family transcriptional regulator
MSVTRDEVAKLAGVSPITVSRVFRGSGLVAEDTRQRVIGVARQAKYSPHAGARAMRCGRFGRIAFALVQYGQPGEPYSPTNLYGYMNTATHGLAEHGYSLALEPLSLNLQDEYIQSPRLFAELGMDGVIGFPSSGYVPPQVDRQLSDLGAPVVWLNRNTEAGLECFNCDEIANAKLLTNHLIGLGHKQIAYVGYDTPHYAGAQRHEGVRAALTEAGLTTEHVLMSPRHGCMNESAEQLLDDHSAATAAVCYSRVAFDTILHHAARRGVRIPRDLSVCYFASVWELPWADYKATALEVPEREMAVAAVARLLERIEKQPAADTPPAMPVGRVLPGWTTARPGEDWPEGVPRCDHEHGVCVIKGQR